MTHSVKVVEVEAQVLAAHLEVHRHKGLRPRGRGGAGQGAHEGVNVLLAAFQSLPLI